MEIWQEIVYYPLREPHELLILVNMMHFLFYCTIPHFYRKNKLAMDTVEEYDTQRINCSNILEKCQQ